MADATKLRAQHNTQDMLERTHSLEIIAALARKLGGEVRLRFRDLHSRDVTIWHDESTDEMVILAKPDPQ